MDLLKAADYQSDGDEATSSASSNYEESSSSLSSSISDDDGATVTTTAQHHFERSIPHIDGNWACSLHIPLHGGNTDMDELKSISRSYVQQFQQYVNTCNEVVHVLVVPIPKVHISLSRVFYLQYHLLATFEADIRLRLGLEHSFVAHIHASASNNNTCSPRVLVNDERTRTFLALSVQQPHATKSSCSTTCVPGSSPSHGGVVRLIRAVDSVLEKYGLPTYYDNPIVHVSVGSAKGDFSGASGTFQDADDDVDTIPVRVNSIECKVGTVKGFTVDLQR